ncbi:MAG: beta-ketoacyl synthase chain length factor [Leptospirales bacterium]
MGPGLTGWKDSMPFLTHPGRWRMDPLCVPDPIFLPAVERRRAGQTVRLALAVGFEAHLNAQRDPSRSQTIFTSSGGDTPSLHANCEALLNTAPELSPTRFHNSVHNAPAGYWGIAAQSREASTSLCAFDASFSVGLLHACVHVVVDRRVVALIAYDVPYLEPIAHVRPILSAFATALVLAPEKTDHAIACLDIMRVDGGECAPWPDMDPGLAELSRGIPAARSLPLLVALASEIAVTVDIEELPKHRLVIQVLPC